MALGLHTQVQGQLEDLAPHVPLAGAPFPVDANDVALRRELRALSQVCRCVPLHGLALA